MASQDALGRLQMYLVLATLASADFALAAPFQASVGARRKVLYGVDITTAAGQKVFFDNARTTLLLGGFDPAFVDQINWNNFLIPGVWAALKMLSENLLLMSPYTGTDCPCITTLVGYARSQEDMLSTTLRSQNDTLADIQKRLAVVESKLP